MTNNGYQLVQTVQRQPPNIVSGDKTWIHYFEPFRKLGIEIWQSKHGKGMFIYFMIMLHH